jgi:transcriptional regulator with XRE-family HTH domain
MTGEELKAARQELGWTQSALASAIGTTLRAVQYYEAGERSVPGPVEKIITITLDLANRLGGETK